MRKDTGGDLTCLHFLQVVFKRFQDFSSLPFFYVFSFRHFKDFQHPSFFCSRRSPFVCSAEAIKAMVSEVDLDGDGEISFDEFVTGKGRRNVRKQEAA